MGPPTQSGPGGASRRTRILAAPPAATEGAPAKPSSASSKHTSIAQEVQRAVISPPPRKTVCPTPRGDHATNCNVGFAEASSVSGNVRTQPIPYPVYTGRRHTAKCLPALVHLFWQNRCGLRERPLRSWIMQALLVRDSSWGGFWRNGQTEATIPHIYMYGIVAEPASVSATSQSAYSVPVGAPTPRTRGRAVGFAATRGRSWG